MYFVSVILLLLIFPLASVGIQMHRAHEASLLFLVGKWWVFWAVGIRLFLAGVRQVAQPRFTAEGIFGVHDPASFPIVREVGFANLSFGILGLCSFFRPDWVVPAAIVGGLYYGLAGIGHLPSKNKNAKEYIAMITDAFVFLVLAVFVVKCLA